MNNLKNVSITVCILTYNRKFFLQKTIDSALTQKYVHKKVLVLDDCSNDGTDEMMSKVYAKNNLIKYVKNDVNIGLSRNFMKSFSLIDTDIALFIGDDDIFIDEQALTIYVDAFKNEAVGIARSKQILFDEGGIKQIAKITCTETYTLYDNIKNAYSEFVFESISIAGLAFRTAITQSQILADFPTMYPQYLLVAKLALISKCVQINKYLVGIRSHKSQLNVMEYKLIGFRTNIFEDMNSIYYNLSNFVISNNLRYRPTKQETIKKVFGFLPILLPQNTINKGYKSTFNLIKMLLKENPKIIFTYKVLMIITSIFLPKNTILFIVKLANKTLLNKNGSYVENFRQIIAARM